MLSLNDADIALLRAENGVPEPIVVPMPVFIDKLTCLPIDNAYDFHQMFFPEEELYRWQIEQLMQLSGYCDPYNPASRAEPTKEAPLLATLCAANGSGKDMIVLSTWALWEICCHVQAHWIGTSSSFTQLDQQTWRHIKARAEVLQKLLGARELEITKFKVIYKKSKSEITLFRTDEDDNRAQRVQVAGPRARHVLPKVPRLHALVEYLQLGRLVRLLLREVHDGRARLAGADGPRQVVFSQDHGQRLPALARRV